MFDRLDFIYLPSDDVAADVEHYTEGLGGELGFAIERFGTRVAMVRASAERVWPAARTSEIEFAAVSLEGLCTRLTSSRLEHA